MLILVCKGLQKPLPEKINLRQFRKQPLLFACAHEGIRCFLFLQYMCLYRYADIKLHYCNNDDYEFKEF